MRPAQREAQLAKPAADREARLVAVVPRLDHADRRAHQLVSVKEVADAPQLVGHDLLLQLELERVLGVLPAAPAAAGSVVRTGRIDSPGARLPDPTKPGPA